ncbi:MAG: hypothetical protein KKA19_01455, partial [Candidatus Margulisbacteria bacterium]|nr:hypothetical protein [Candidatus Margulisiibacteriota bacterium]
QEKQELIQSIISKYYEEAGYSPFEYETNNIQYFLLYSILSLEVSKKSSKDVGVDISVTEAQQMQEILYPVLLELIDEYFLKQVKINQ